MQLKTDRKHEITLLWFSSSLITVIQFTFPAHISGCRTQLRGRGSQPSKLVSRQIHSFQSWLSSQNCYQFFSLSLISSQTFATLLNCYSTPHTTFNKELLRVNKGPLSLLTLTNPTSFCSSSYSLLSRPWRGGTSGKAPTTSCVLDSIMSNLLSNLIPSRNHLVTSPSPSLQAPSPQTIPIFNKS